MASSTLRFQIEVASDQATEALRAVTAAINEAGVKMKGSFLAVGPAVRGAGTEIGGLTESIKRFVSEERGQARTARFFVSEIAQIIPISGGAKAAMTQFGGALLAGGPVALGIGAGIAALGLLAEWYRHSAEEAKKAAEAVEKHAKGLRDMRAETDAFIRQARGSTAGMEFLYGKQNEFNEKTLASRTRLAEVNTKLAALEVALANPRRDVSIMGPSISERNALLAEQAKLTKEIAAAQADLDEAKRQTGARVGAEEEKGALEASERELKAREERFDREHQLVEEADAHIKAYYKHLEELAKHDADLMEAMRQAEIDAANKVFEAEYEAEQKSAKKRAEDFKQNYVQPMVSAFTSGIREMLEGEKTFADFTKDMLSSMVDALVSKLNELLVAQIAAALTGEVIEKSKAVSEISANAGIAGSGAAASQAAIPIVGPELAIAAMAATSAAVLAAMLPLASAAQGFDVPAGFNGLVNIHSREMVLPEQYADVIRQGGSRGWTVNIVGPMDGRSVERVFASNQGPIAKIRRRWDRRGRA
jgi:hypothetical protein